MLKNTIRISIASTFILLSSCSDSDHLFDASGSFEAEEIIISSEASGTIRALDLNEGQVLKPNQRIGYIDSTQLHLKKRQLIAQRAAVLGKKPDIALQLAALKEQLKSAERDQSRIKSLVESDAATSQQLDDINSRVDMIRDQIRAQQSSLEISSNSLSNESAPLSIQIEQLEDQLSKCNIINPISGTVLTRYARIHEMTSPGKPLYKIADLSTITLRMYVTGDQLPGISLGQEVKVHTDDGTGGYKEYEGVISWINDQAEFTPKTIQTKDERANKVYAVKVRVKNDGYLKIGMYGEVKFQ